MIRNDAYKTFGNMKNNNLIDISIPSVLNMRSLSHLDNDLVLFDHPSEVLPIGKTIRCMCIIVMLCLKGKIEYSTEKSLITIHSHQSFIIHESQIISDFKASHDAKVIGLIMSSSFLNEIVRNVSQRSSLILFSYSHPIFYLQENEMLDVMNYYKLMKKKSGEDNHFFRRDVMRSLLLTMTCDLSNMIYRILLIKDKKNVRAEAIFIDFINLVEQNYKQERRVSWYANQLCITPKHLSETVKQVSNRTPIEWIDDYVTMEIRSLLKNTPKSIKEISTEMHFPNQSFFGKYFKQHVGMSPLAYRKTK